MLGVTYAMLLAGGALAYYGGGGGGDERNRVQRYEVEHRIEPVEVECPVCGDLASWLSSREDCSLMRDGKRYKRCQHGAYRNEQCGNRLDCFRGPGERCSEKLTNDNLGQRCAPGSFCHPTQGLCVGIDYDVDTGMLKTSNPYPFAFLEDRKRPVKNYTSLLELLAQALLREEGRLSLTRLEYPVREKRAV